MAVIQAEWKKGGSELESTDYTRNNRPPFNRRPGTDAPMRKKKNTKEWRKVREHETELKKAFPFEKLMGTYGL